MYILTNALFFRQIDIAMPCCGDETSTHFTPILSCGVSNWSVFSNSPFHPASLLMECFHYISFHLCYIDNSFGKWNLGLNFPVIFGLIYSQLLLKTWSSSSHTRKWISNSISHRSSPNPPRPTWLTSTPTASAVAVDLVAGSGGRGRSDLAWAVLLGNFLSTVRGKD